MRIASWFSLLVISAVLAVGCKGGGEAAPEDNAFQKSLAEAAAKNKDGAPSRKNSMKKPPTDPSAKPGTTTQ